MDYMICQEMYGSGVQTYIILTIIGKKLKKVSLQILPERERPLIRKNLMPQNVCIVEGRSYVMIPIVKDIG